MSARTRVAGSVSSIVVVTLAGYLHLCQILLEAAPNVSETCTGVVHTESRQHLIGHARSVDKQRIAHAVNAC